MLFEDNRYYLIREVADVLALSRRTVSRKIDAGELPPAHPGLRRVRGRDLNLCIANRLPWHEIRVQIEGDPMLDEASALRLLGRGTHDHSLN